MEWLKKIIYFLRYGYRKSTVHPKPNTFLKYVLYYPINWFATLGLGFFIYVLVKGGIRYESPALFVMAIIPSIILIYNFVSEYFAYKNKGKGKELMYIFFGAAFAVLLYVISRIFVG